MKIGIVCYPTFGGSGVVATELGIELANKGHKVHFISYEPPVRLDLFNQNIFYHEVRVPNYPLFEFAPYETALTSKIVDVALYENLDILHVHYAIPHASAAYMARAILQARGKKLPFVTTLHGTDITLVGKDPSYRPVIRFTIENSDAVTAVSDDLRKDTFTHFQVKKEIEVIYNFLKTELYQYRSEDCIRKFAAPNDEKLMVHVSNFRPVKRISDVIKTFDIVKKSFPKVKLLMVGDGPERSPAEDLVRQLGLENDVTFIGKIKSTWQVLPCSDLFLLPSETESFGVSALEALASGVPVITTNAGGLPEVQIHGKTGFMSNVGDIEDMANNSLKLLKDDVLRAEFSQNAKERANEFSVDKIVPLYEALYEKLVAKYAK
jgi:N-acetyl-alpha-D-glucosaminyl L-malate synthase BshA